MVFTEKSDSSSFAAARESWVEFAFSKGFDRKAESLNKGTNIRLQSGEFLRLP